MTNMINQFCKLAAVLALCSFHSFAAQSVDADQVDVTITGVVEFNQINSGLLGMVNPGDPTTLTFSFDSNNFVNSPNFPTRGYEIDLSSFVLDFNGNTIGLQDPFPNGQTPYFVLRNDDPAVDGFFVSTSFDFPVGVPLDQTGAFSQFMNNFYVTYTGDTLSSLDVLDALGTYDFTGLTVFNWTVDDGPFNPMGLVFSDMTISSRTIPEPSVLVPLLGLGGVLMVRRRK